MTSPAHELPPLYGQTSSIRQNRSQLCPVGVLPLGALLRLESPLAADLDRGTVHPQLFQQLGDPLAQSVVPREIRDHEIGDHLRRRTNAEVGNGADLRVDLRLGEETGGSSLAKGGRVLDEAGKTSFLVGDEHEGEAACLVVLDDAGTVLANRMLRVGGE